MIAGEQDCLEAKEILAICKVLLESCLMHEELFPMLGKLIRCGNPDAQRQLHNFIENERYHYTPTCNMANVSPRYALEAGAGRVEPELS